MVTESWFGSLWKSSKKHENGDKKAMVIGVLAFELAKLMSKLINLWHSLGDNQVSYLREEISNEVGIKKLVSEDEDHIVKLMTIELMEKMTDVAKSVSRLSKNCDDPVLKSFEQAFNDMCKIGVDSYGWLLTMKKMEKKMIQMKRLVVATTNLYQEMETLDDLEQELKKMKSSDDVGSNLIEYEKKIAWKQEEVKYFKQISIWNRTYDEIVILLAGSLFTVFCRTGHVFGINHVFVRGVNDDSRVLRGGCSLAFTQSSLVHPSENRTSTSTRFSSGGLLGKAIAKSGPIIGRYNKSSSRSFSVGVGSSSPSFEKHEIMNYYSGPLVKSVTKSGLLAKASKSGSKLWQSRNQLSFFSAFSKRNKLKISGPFDINTSKDIDRSNEEVVSEFCVLGKGIHGNRLKNAAVGTLGGAALALHYANIIIVIEKLMTAPHLISRDTRDELYNMLPAKIKSALTAKLKPYGKAMFTSVCDTDLAAEWDETISEILEWLAPLAHNMIRWQFEQSTFEHQNTDTRTNVMLVQTLHFANQEKAEASVIELLVGLNYVSRYSQELHASNMTVCTSGTTFDDYVENLSTG